MSVRKRIQRDDGAGTVLTLTAIAVVLALTTGLLTSMSIFDQWNQAKRFADEVALATSLDLLRDPTNACTSARTLASNNGYLFVQCVIMEDTVLIRLAFTPRAKLAKMSFPTIQVRSMASMQSGL